MQVNRLAWTRLEGWGGPARASASRFETHRSAIAAMLLSMRPKESYRDGPMIVRWNSSCHLRD